MRSFKDYFREYKEFYKGILDLAKIENKASKKELSYTQEKKYQEIYKEIMLQCPVGTDIENLIGLVVVGEARKNKNLLKKLK